MFVTKKTTHIVAALKAMLQVSLKGAFFCQKHLKNTSVVSKVYLKGVEIFSAPFFYSQLTSILCGVIRILPD